ncbi:MAG: hypothetical protein J3R72DRAFT_56399 [Linnemannia gamsii]|nr:MAG: hypothetical protein J3R72DRAFT_56399 [Linnemannia gamsii]
MLLSPIHQQQQQQPRPLTSPYSYQHHHIIHSSTATTTSNTHSRHQSDSSSSNTSTASSPTKYNKRTLQQYRQEHLDNMSITVEEYEDVLNAEVWIEVNKLRDYARHGISREVRGVRILFLFNDCHSVQSAYPSAFSFSLCSQLGFEKLFLCGVCSSNNNNHRSNARFSLDFFIFLLFSLHLHCRQINQLSFVSRTSIKKDQRESGERRQQKAKKEGKKGEAGHKRKAKAGGWTLCFLSLIIHISIALDFFFGFCSRALHPHIPPFRIEYWVAAHLNGLFLCRLQ